MEGKRTKHMEGWPSMKVPSKRKGNRAGGAEGYRNRQSLNESPFEKEGKFHDHLTTDSPHRPLNESPFEKEGKSSPKLRLT